MKTELKNIASVLMGYSFRSRLDVKDSGTVAVIQMKDLTDDNRVDCSNLSRVDSDSPKEHHLVRPGDLVFRSRGLTATSAILRDNPGMAVVSAPLLRIRANEKIILPEYLNWFISQTSAQSFLASRVIGTAQKMISKEALESLEVLVPSLEQQHTIMEIAALADREQAILSNLADKRKLYLSKILLRMAQGELR